jgi:stage V sporulation protein SpoVS
MLIFKAKQTTNPSKLASAIAHNIANSDITVDCLGPQAVNAAAKGLIIAKKYIQNEPYTLTFDLFSLEEVDSEGITINVIQFVVSKVDR